MADLTDLLQPSPVPHDMTELDQYNKWKQDQAQREAAAAAIVLADAKRENADKYSAGMTLAGIYRAPVEMMTDEKIAPVFTADLEKRRNQLLLSTAPNLTQWLISDPNNAKIAHDDVKPLSWWETIKDTHDGLERAMERGTVQAGAGFMSMASQLASLTGEDQKHNQFESTTKVAEDGAASTTYSAMGGARWIMSRIATAMGKDMGAGEAKYIEQGQKLMDMAEKIPKGVKADRFFAEVKSGDPNESVVSKWLTAMAHDPAGAFAFSLETAGEFAPIIAAAGITTAATKNPFMGATVMGAGNFVVDAGTSPYEFFKQKGYNIGQPGEIDRLMKDKATLDEAARQGHIHGLITSMGAMLGMGIASKTLAKNPILELFAQGVTQAVLDAGSEAVGEVASGQGFDMNNVMAELMTGFVSAPFDMAAAGHGQLAEIADARKAQGRVDFFKQLSGQAANSVLRGRMPEAFAGYVKKQTEGGPAENIYIKGSEVADYFQSQGLDPNDFLGQFSITKEDLKTAIETHGDVVIPTAEYAAHMAGGEHDRFIMENMRLKPDDMSAKEAVGVQAQIDQIMQDAREIGAKLDLHDMESVSFREQIRNEMAARLQAIGRAADVSRVEGLYIAELYGAMAQRTGHTVEELLSRIPLPNIRGQVPQGMQQARVDRITHTMALVRQREAIRAGAPAPGSTVAARDMGWVPGVQDQQAQPTVQTTGLADGALPTDTQETIAPATPGPDVTDGQPQGEVAPAGAAQVAPTVTQEDIKAFTGEADTPDAIALNDHLDAVQAYLNDLGLTHDNTDAEIRAAIQADADRIAGERTLNQANTLRAGGPENLRRYGLEPGKRYTTRQIAEALEKRQREKYGTIERDDRSPQSARKIGKWMAEEVMYEISNMPPEQSAVGWYSTKFQAALDIFGSQFPELVSDQEMARSNMPGLQILGTRQGARDFFTALIAVTSDGMKVKENFTLAAQLYRHFRDWGEVPPFTAGNDRARTIAANAAEAARLIKEYGPEGFRSYLMTENTISKLKKIVEAAGGKLSSDYPANRTLPQSAVVFGPKLGAFFANLMGSTGYLTMDRWWSRTFNRYRGQLTTSPSSQGIARVGQLIGQEEGIDTSAWTPEQVIAAAKKYEKAYKDKKFKNGTELEKAANTVIKDSVGTEDAPFNSSDRGFMIDSVVQAQKTLANKHKVDMSIADIQAVLWYYEKRLLGDLGARQTADISYEDAAHLVARTTNADANQADDGSGAYGLAGEGPGDPEAIEFGGGTDLSPQEADALAAEGGRSSGQGPAPGQVQGNAARLTGLPASSVGPNPDINNAARKYLAGQGIAHRRQAAYVQIDRDRATRIAQAFEEMKHDPQDPDVQAAYQQLIVETTAQYQAVLDMGLKIDVIEEGMADPYPEGPKQVLEDLRNGHIWLYPTSSGFGTINSIEDNPLLVPTSFSINGHPLLANDLFRVVHDVFGHGREGVGFGASGEENTWQSHVRMFSPLAARAMTTETRGQNSWVNYGPHGEHNRANQRDTVYADQKIGLLPEWVTTEGIEDAPDVSNRTYDQPAFHGSPYAHDSFDMSKIGSGEGIADHGWGIYFSRSEAGADLYRSTYSQPTIRFSNGTSITQAMLNKVKGQKGVLQQNAFGRVRVEGLDAALRTAEEDALARPFDKASAAIAKQLRAWKDAGARIESEGRTFEVDVPEDAELLNWNGGPTHEMRGRLEAAGIKYGEFVPLSANAIDYNRARGGMGMAAIKFNGKTYVSQVHTIAIADAAADNLRAGETMEEAEARIGQYLDEHTDDMGAMGLMSGREIYEALSKKLGSDRKASEALRDAGVPGLRYAKGQGELVVWDQARLKIGSYVNGPPGGPRTMLFNQDQTGAPRGQISIPEGGITQGATISIFQGADLTTVIHEMGHFMLEMLRHFGTNINSPQQIRDDYQTIMNWNKANAADVARDGKAATGTDITADDVIAAIENGTTGDGAKDHAIDIGMHEQFAKAAEDYALQGKAPSVELQSVLEKFRTWVVRVYKRLKALTAQGQQTNITPEVSRVFDRMLATDQQIEHAQAAAGDAEMLFNSAAAMGVSEEAYAKLQALHEKARADATGRLLAEAMAPVAREQKAWYKREKERVRGEVTKELQGAPVYRAIQELRFGKGYDGNDIEPRMKMATQVISDEFGPSYLPLLPGSAKDGKSHRFAVHTTEGGVHPDVVAGMYGFASGQELLDMMVKVPPLKQAVDAETEKRMFELHGDPLNDGNVEQIAQDAVHNDKKAQYLAAELAELHAIAGKGRAMTWQEAKSIAQRMLRDTKVGLATPARYLAAERKAARLAIKLMGIVTRSEIWTRNVARRAQTLAKSAVAKSSTEGLVSTNPKVGGLNEKISGANERIDATNKQIDELIAAKRAQLLNHALYDGARQIQNEMDRIITILGKLNRGDKKATKGMDLDHVKAVRAIAASFGLARPDPTFDFLAWMQQLIHDDPVAASAMQSTILTYQNGTQAAANKKAYKDMTVDEVSALWDAVDTIMTMGRTLKQIEIQGKTVEKEAAKQELMDVILRRKPAQNVQLAATHTATQKLRIKALGLLSSLKRMEAWARDMDDGKVGPYTKYLVRPIMDALDKYHVDKNERIKALKAILDPMKDALTKRAIAAPEIGFTFQNKGELLHALLHTGNDSNKRKLLIGWKWGTLDADGNLDSSKWDSFVARAELDGTITKEDYDFAQKVWDLMESTKRPAQRAHRKMYGYYFHEVENKPFDTAFGRYRGGYIPARADRYASADGGVREAEDLLNNQQNMSMFPTTGNGFTKSRVETYATPLALDLSLLPAHLDKVIRFTHLEPTIRQTAGLVMDQEMKHALAHLDPTVSGVLILPWLQRTAMQIVETPSLTEDGRVADSFFRYMRRNAGLSTMFFNVVNTLQNLTGFAPALLLAKAGPMKSAVVRFARQGSQMRQEMIDTSPFMAQHSGNETREIMGRIEDIMDKPGNVAAMNRWITRNGYVLQTATQSVVDTIVWHAAYDTSIGKGMTHEDAVFEADSTIRRTMGSMSAEGVSKFETGGAFKRLFTMFYSYFNAQANLVGGEMATTMRTMGWGGTGRMFYIYLMGMAIPAVVGEIIARSFRGGLGDDDDKDGSIVDDFAWLFFGSQGKYALGMAPVVGAFTTAAVNRFNSQFFDDRLNVSPALSLADRMLSVPSEVLAGIQEPAKRGPRALQDTIQALGVILGVPLGQLSKTVGYGANVAAGNQKPTGPVDVVQGVLTGRDGSKK